MPLRDVLLALAVVFIWGINFVAIKWGVSEISPYLLTGLRYLGCALPAIFFVRRPPVSWWLLIAYGLSVGVLQFGLLFAAIKFGMPAGLASLLMQVQVFFTLVLAVLFLGERPTLPQVVGAVVALAGLGLIGAEHLGGAMLGPLLMTMVAALFWGISNILTKRAGNIDMLGFVVWSSLVAPLPMLVLALLVEGPQAVVALFSISPRAVGSMLFITYCSTLVGYVGWAVLLGRHPASLVAPFSLLVPVVGFAAAYLLLGEQISGPEIAGSVLIFIGLVLTITGPRLLARLRAA